MSESGNAEPTRTKSKTWIIIVIVVVIVAAAGIGAKLWIDAQRDTQQWAKDSWEKIKGGNAGGPPATAPADGGKPKDPAQTE